MLNTKGRGYLPGSGQGAGIKDTRGGSGGSHGGLGGMGSYTTHAAQAYGRFRTATEYGSGGSYVSDSQVCRTYVVHKTYRMILESFTCILLHNTHK